MTLHSSSESGLSISNLRDQLLKRLETLFERLAHNSDAIDASIGNEEVSNAM